jgi:hypothetical protein
MKLITADGFSKNWGISVCLMVLFLGSRLIFMIVLSVWVSVENVLVGLMLTLPFLRAQSWDHFYSPFTSMLLVGISSIVVITFSLMIAKYTTHSILMTLIFIYFAFVNGLMSNW